MPIAETSLRSEVTFLVRFFNCHEIKDKGIIKFRVSGLFLLLIKFPCDKEEEEDIYYIMFLSSGWRVGKLLSYFISFLYRWMGDIWIQH